MVIGPAKTEPLRMLVSAESGKEILLMKGKRFSVEQIVGVLKQAEMGVPVVQLIRKAGISEQTSYSWKKHYESTT